MSLPSPTFVFLDAHSDPSTPQFLTESYEFFADLTFLAEENIGGGTSDPEIKRHHILLTQTAIDKIRTGEIKLSEKFPKLSAQELNSTREIFRDRKTIAFWNSFLQKLKPGKYREIEFRQNELDALIKLGLDFAFRDLLYAFYYLAYEAFGVFGLGHLIGLQTNLIKIATEFGITKAELDDMFIFVYIFVDPPRPDLNHLETRIREGTIKLDFPLHCFDRNITSSSEIRKQLNALRIQKSIRLACSPFKYFRHQHQRQLLRRAEELRDVVRQMTSSPDEHTKIKNDEKESSPSSTPAYMDKQTALISTETEAYSLFSQGTSAYKSGKYESAISQLSTARLLFAELLSKYQKFAQTNKIEEMQDTLATVYSNLGSAHFQAAKLSPNLTDSSLVHIHAAETHLAQCCLIREGILRSKETPRMRDKLKKSQQKLIEVQVEMSSQKETVQPESFFPYLTYR